MACRWLVGRMVCRSVSTNYLKGREVSLPSSYRSTCSNCTVPEMHESDEFVGIWIAGHHQQLLRPHQQDLHFPLRQDLHLLLKHGLQFNVHEGGNKCKQGGKASKQQDLHFPKEALPASPKYINCLCAITRSH